MKRARLLFVACTLAYAAVLVALAFVQWEAGAACPWFWSVLAFIPMGLLLELALGRRRWWAAIGFGVLGAAWIEAAQAIWMPPGYGRFEDAAWASAGVLLGVLLGAVTLRSMHSHESFSIVTDGGSREIPSP